MEEQRFVGGHEELTAKNGSNPVADPAMGGPPPIDQKLGLVMAARLKTRGQIFT